MNQKLIKDYIHTLEHIIILLRSLLDEEIKTIPAPSTERDRIAEFTDLRFLTKSNKWPEAVPEELICDDKNEDQKLARASGIITDIIHTDIIDKVFLDFGCGEGHIPYIAANINQTKKAVGYDTKEQNWSNFEKNKNLIFTDSFREVKENGPYDVILLNDVLDHTNNPKQTLEQIREVKKPQTGRVYVRCHPWCSRHGTHLYKTLNKAYLNLVFSKEELSRMGLKEIKTNELTIDLYKNLFKDAGFTVTKETITNQPLESFFTQNEKIFRRIKEKLGDSFREKSEIQFIDFTLI